MRKAVWSGVATAAAVLMFSTSAFAQTVQATANVTVSAQVDAKAKLDLHGATTAHFNDADPDTLATLTATSAITIDVKARTTGNGQVTLTVLASDDLKSGTDAIAINQLSWTAGGALSAGTMGLTAQSLGSWTGPGLHTGTQTYKLVNSWAYVTGAYSTLLTYTLTAP
jgi:hypothetical protein